VVLVPLELEMTVLEVVAAVLVVLELEQHSLLLVGSFIPSPLEQAALGVFIPFQGQTGLIQHFLLSLLMVAVAPYL
jgi:hypothetical protein